MKVHTLPSSDVVIGPDANFQIDRSIPYIAGFVNISEGFRILDIDSVMDVERPS